MRHKSSENPPLKNTSSKSPKISSYKIKLISAVDMQVFAKDFKDAHNEFRNCHGCQKLGENKKLSVFAQVWADRLATLDRMEHNPDQQYGENVYSCSGFEPTGFHVSQTWYSEQSKYDYKKPSFSTATGHFTNMIWRETSRFGIGVARSSTGKYYVVANYDPVGNVTDEFERNIPPRRPNARPVEEMMPKSSHLFGFRFNEFQRTCLDVHNEFRIKHHSQELKLQAAMCEDAQRWAEQLAAANEVAYKAKGPIGQNIYCQMDRIDGVDLGRAVREWYSEIRQFSGQLNAETSHFTQLVWHETRELGIGVAKSRTGEVYTVAHYFPPGNIAGKLIDNVKNWQKIKKQYMYRP